MSVKDEVLKALLAADGDYLSGQALADTLSVSRHAVWKAIDKLRSEGYEIEARTNQGYCLVTTGNQLSTENVRRFLENPNAFELEYFESIGSTNDRARELAEAGAPAWTVVLANAQTKGRGRMGRSFCSPESTGLYMSVIVRPECEVRHASLLTIAAAEATARAIEKVCGVTAQIKWVNDIFVDGRKVSGILTEASVGLEERALRYAVVGIGINVAAPEDGFPEEIGAVAGSVLREVPDDDIRARLAAALLEALKPSAEHLTERAYLDGYRKRLMMLGREVKLLRGNEQEKVFAEALDDDGALVVIDAKGERRTINSGEVSLRF